MHCPHFYIGSLLSAEVFWQSLVVGGRACKDAVSAEVDLAQCFLSVRSVAATCLCHHTLVMPHYHLPVLIVEHGERSQLCRYAGWTRDTVRLVQLQQAL